MLKLGFLAKEALATTNAYDNVIIKKYLNAVAKVFKKINYFQERNIRLPLKGPLRHSTLERLTY